MVCFRLHLKFSEYDFLKKKTPLHKSILVWPHATALIAVQLGFFCAATERQYKCFRKWTAWVSVFTRCTDTHLRRKPTVSARAKHTCCGATGSNLGWHSHQHIRAPPPPPLPEGLSSDSPSGSLCINQSIHTRMHVLARNPSPPLPAYQCRHVTPGLTSIRRPDMFWSRAPPSISAGLLRS